MKVLFDIIRKNDLRNGVGQMTYKDKSKYNGNFVIERMNIENKMNKENMNKYNDNINKYEKIIKDERKKVQNAYSVISKLRAELDYIKNENLQLLKSISKNNRKEYLNVNNDEDIHFLSKDKNLKDNGYINNNNK